MTELLEVAPREITSNPKNPRRSVADVADLAASIKEHGILEPLVVAPQVDGGKGTYQLIAGHRRLAAAKSARVKTVPVILRSDLDTAPLQLEAALVENLHRTDLSPIEEGEGYQTLLEFPGYTQTRVAKATGRSTSTVRDRLKLTKLPAKTRELIHDGQIALADAIAMAEFSDDAKSLKALTAAAGTANFRWELENRRRARKDAKDADRARKELEAAGVRIVPDPGVKYNGDPGPRRLNEYGGPKVDVDEHAKTCEHHAAAEPKSGHVTYVCLDPTVHADIDNTGQPVSHAEKAAAKKERETAEQLAQDIATAAALRGAFIASLVMGARKIVDPGQLIERHVLRLLVVAYVEPGPDAVAECLALKPAEGESDVSEEQLFAEVERRSTAQMFLAVAAADAEPGLVQFWNWRNGLGATSLTWLQLLVDLGYDLSEFESSAVGAAGGGTDSGASPEA